MNLRIALMYHDVYHNNIKESGFQNSGAIQYKLTSANFKSQISEIAKFCESGKIDKTQIALTFDDGGESFHSVIAPILEMYSFKGYFFITTGLIGNPGFINREQIIDLHNRGHFIGAHTHTHPKNLLELSSTEIEKEWSKSVETLNEILPEKIKIASVPGGFYSEPTRIALKKNNIELIFTSLPTTKIIHDSDNLQIIGRFSIKNNTSNETVLQLIKNNSLRQFFELFKWRALALIRLLLGNKYYRIREILLKTRQ